MQGCVGSVYRVDTEKSAGPNPRGSTWGAGEWVVAFKAVGTQDVRSTDNRLCKTDDWTCAGWDSTSTPLLCYPEGRVSGWEMPGVREERGIAPCADRRTRPTSGLRSVSPARGAAACARGVGGAFTEDIIALILNF